MLQYSEDGTQSAQYSYNSEGVAPVWLPAFIFKGIAQDTAQNMYMLAALYEDDTVRWQVLKFGDLQQFFVEHQDTIRAAFEELSLALAGFMNTPSFQQKVKAFSIAQANTSMDYSQFLYVYADSVAGFVDSAKAYLQATGASMASVNNLDEVIQGITIDAITIRPTLFAPQFDSTYFYHRCWDRLTPERVSYWTTHRDSIPYYDTLQVLSFQNANAALDENTVEQIPTWFVGYRLHATGASQQTEAVINPPSTEKFWEKCGSVAPFSAGTLEKDRPAPDQPNGVCGTPPNTYTCQKWHYKCEGGKGSSNSECGRTGFFNNDCAKNFTSDVYHTQSSQ